MPIPFAVWQHRVSDASNTFQTLVDAAEAALRSGDATTAIRRVQEAANFAAGEHIGQFSSPQLDALLIRMSAHILAPLSSPSPNDRVRVLHICSQVFSIGGHTRVVQNWIDKDPQNQHHVVLTQQRQLPVPEALAYAVRKSKGRLHSFGKESVSEVASAVRQIANDCEFIVLHIHPNDIAAMLALGGMARRPPVAFFNHGDHVFSVGQLIADGFVDLRESGRSLSLRRRGVLRGQSLLLPIPLKPSIRKKSRQEAKIALGLPPDDLLLLSIGSPHKFRPLGEIDFARVHLPVVEAFPDCRMIVVGPSSDEPYWRQWEAATNGRIKAAGQTPLLAPYHEAADIVIDPFPFASLTALLEAVLFENPAVSYSPYPPFAGADVLRSDDLSLADFPYRFNDHQAYLAEISALLSNADLRAGRGQAMAAAVKREHMDENWSARLRAVYERTNQLFRSRGAFPKRPAPEPPGPFDLILAAFIANIRG